MHKKKWLSVLIGTIIGTMSLPASVFAADSATALPKTEGKPRLLVTQDGEVDDMNTLIHTLLYSNDIDLEGIVQTSSKLHYSGDDTTESLRWMGTDWMYEFLDAYAEVYDNLKIHDEDYPSPDDLRAITKVGNIKNVSDTSEETEGSELVKERILAEDDRPLYIEVGGGANTVARALMSIEEEYKDQDGWEELYNRICEKVILFAWGMSSAWMKENIEQNLGALMDKYVTWGDGTYLEGEADTDQYGTNEALLGDDTLWVGHAYEQYDFLSEGDSPAWFVTIPNGLRSLEDLSYGGWDGRYALKENDENPDVRLYQAAKGNEKGIAQWIAAIQSDFAMRAKWCVTDKYEDANHLPEVSVEEGIDLTAKAGDEITLNGTAVDPDGDTTTFRWYHYPYGDTYEEAEDEDGNPVAIEVTASGENQETATFTIPEDAKSGDTIHIIMEGVDGGGTNPVAYQRVIVTVE